MQVILRFWNTAWHASPHLIVSRFFWQFFTSKLLSLDEREESGKYTLNAVETAFGFRFSVFSPSVNLYAVGGTIFFSDGLGLHTSPILAIIIG